MYHNHGYPHFGHGYDSMDDDDAEDFLENVVEPSEKHVLLISLLVLAASLIIVLGTVCYCCCKRRTQQGRILRPPAPKPTQRTAENTELHQEHLRPYPVSGALHPVIVAPNPTYLEAGVPYSTSEVPYPAAAVCYSTEVPSQVHSYPTKDAGFSHAAPSAPQCDAPPPSYAEAVVDTSTTTNNTPYNPNM